MKHKEKHLRTASVHKYVAIVLLAVVVASCGPTRRLSDDEYWLRKNEIDMLDDSEIRRSSLNEIIRQQPNRRFLGVFHLSVWAHNLPNPEVVERNAQKKRKRHEEKSQERIEKGKQPRRYKRTFGEWLRYGLGTAPVVLDTMQAEQAARQMSLFMLKEGYFQNEVTHDIEYFGRKRARVIYSVKSGPAHRIRHLTQRIPDPNLKYITDREAGSSLIHSGQRFSVTRMDRERDRLMRFFKNEGFFDLSKEEIYFQVDSTIGNLQVDMLMGIQPLRRPYALNPDSLIELNHIRYRLNEVTVNRTHIAPRPGMDAIVPTDTVRYEPYTFVGNPAMYVKPGILAQQIRFEPGQLYSRERLENTHRSLAGLEAFSGVNIRFERLPETTEGEGLLNCQVLLTPAPKQQIVFETRGTHQSGFFGTAGSITYRNRNLFKGAEVFRIRLSGAFEAQQLLTGGGVQEELSGLLQDQTVFNTVEFVPEVSLTIPKFLFPIRIDRIAKSARPFTDLSLSYGFQQRPDFTRNMLRARMSYRWRESDFKTWIVTPAEISFIKIFKSDAFQQRLDALNDLFLNASYSDHLISAFKVSYIFNNQILTRRTNTFFYRGNAETAGNVLTGVMGITGQERDTLGSFRLFDIRYANYVRTDHDLRYYRRFNENSSLVLRFFGGIGIPLRNLEVLPFERSFFGGGANGIRAWLIQTLGPGSYRTVFTTFDRIGEMHLEGNIEYRQKIFSILEGAFFVDAGNIWLLRPDPVRPGGDLALDRFAGEIAIGAGVGARLNFDFFIIRFDLAMQMRDPSMAPGERWAFQPKDDYNSRVDDFNAANPVRRANYYSPRLNLNLGIGYPF